MNKYIRYKNRKLYSTQDQCYVTLEEIAQEVRRGLDVTVIDFTTKTDVTYQTLARCMLGMTFTKEALVNLMRGMQ